MPKETILVVDDEKEIADLVALYLQNEGWVNGIIHFNGKKWTLMDPTFAANSGGSEEVKQFIGNGSNYSTKFVY